MSRSTNVSITNPAEKFFKWSGSKGKFEYWDKDAKTNVEVVLPFKFVVLDSLSTIKGFNDAGQSGYWSNEVKDLSKEILNVYTKVGADKKKVASGLYSDIKGDKNITGAKYCQSLYIATVVDNKLALCNIQLTGSALSSWIEFNKSNDPYKGAIEVKGSTEGKKGATVYKIPTFTSVVLNSELDEEAKELDKVLQDYLTTYFKRAEGE